MTLTQIIREAESCTIRVATESIVETNERIKWLALHLKDACIEIERLKLSIQNLTKGGSLARTR